ncbi:hypothetical protein AAHA92_30340 [Salvia divinorum]|uniref:Uncharacterized protein n=1 Tax=Salvia divinorum TaxID=28513 RepID=A0ABD1G490_SALDI
MARLFRRLCRCEEIENQNEDEIPGAEDDNFWEIQYQLLQSTICRTSSLESRIRNITKEAVKEADSICVCGRPTEVAGNV